jgi:hypothetical protein
MSLNDIQLPEFIIEEWFKDNLINPAPNTTPLPIAPTPQRPTPQASTPPAPQPPAPQPAPQPPEPQPAPQPPAPQPAAPAQAPIKSLGNNRRHITILVNAPGCPILPDNQLNFLTKILEACRMTLADVAIVNNAATETNIATVKEQLHPKTTLLFGLEPSALRLPINFPPFKPIDYDGCTYLSAPGLDQLVPNTEESKLLKSKLWVCLKTIFDV